MRLFLTVSPPPTATGAAADTVPLFDDGVWTRSGPSQEAVHSTSVAFVAREMHRQAALTELLRTSAADVVCFRYGPRPAAAHDALFFHHRHPLAASPPKALSARAPPSMESTGMSSTCVTPWLSLSSVRSLVSSSLEKPAGHLPASPQLTTTFDSLVALWLLETLSVAKQHVAITACLFFVDGSAVDLATRQELYAPLSVHTAAARQLRCAEDVHAYLAHCEQSVMDAARRRNRQTPHHMWMSARVGGGGLANMSPAVTFLDVAYPVDASGVDSSDGDVAARVHEQLRLFRRQLGLAATAAEDSQQLQPSPHNARTTADRRWLGLLQSCQLSRAASVGIFSLAAREGRDVFELSAEEVDCDPFALSAELRRHALADAVNKGVLHPQRNVSRRRGGRRTKKGQRSGAALSPPTSANTGALFLAAPPPSSTHLPPLRQHHRVTVTPNELALSARSPAGAEWRHRDVAALLVAEETAARAALSEGEARARELTWLRWALRAHPPETSTEAVARRLTAAASRVEQPAVQSAPSRRPPPLQQADLAATVRVVSVQRGTPSHRVPRHPSPATAPDLVPILTPAISVSRAASCAASPSMREASAASRVSAHPEFLVQVMIDDDGVHHEVERPRRLSVSVSPQASASTSRVASARRRYSTLEVALLERAHSATRRSSPGNSPKSGSEVELLYPLVRSYHAEVVAQDTMMAAEMMARSKIELREMNRRRTVERWVRDCGANSTAQVPAVGCDSHGRRYYASPRASRVYFDA